VTISIALCTFNGGKYLAEQLASIARQSRLPDELVISDDDSADQSVALAREFAAVAPFPVHSMSNREQVGVIANFERAMARCAGDIVVLADQDDVWSPDKLAAIEGAFEEPDVGLIFSDAEIVDERMTATGARLWQRVGLTPERRRQIEEGLAIDILWPGWSVTGATMAFRAEYRDIFLPIPHHLPMIHDGWIAAIVAGVARVRAIETPLIKYRQHGGQQIGAPARTVPVDRLSARLQRTNAYEREIEIVDRLHERLTSQSRFSLRPGVAPALTNRRRHVRARSAMPSAAHRRAGRVFAELVSGRYHRYSNGLFSAAKDLVLGHHLAPAPAIQPKPEPIPQAVRDKLAGLALPPGRQFVGEGDFLETGFRFLRVFKETCGLEPDEHVLEVGCGIGRMAVPLTQYLSNEGSYHGFDVVQAAIQWCEARITRAYPQFRFSLVDLYNSVYNPAGTLDANAFDFPYADRSFDFVFLTSVFTHLLPTTIVRYLTEIRRVLKDDGRCLITMFLLNDDSRQHIKRHLSSQVPRKYESGYAVADETYPEAAVFYDEPFLTKLVGEHGFRLARPVWYGTWYGCKSGYEYQDVVVLEKIADIPDRPPNSARTIRHDVHAAAAANVRPTDSRK